MSKELKVDRIKCLLSTKQSYPKTIKKKIDKDGHRADKIEKFLKKKLLKHKDCTVYIDGHDYWIYSLVRGVTFVMKDIVFKTTVDGNGAQEDIDYLVSVINKADESYDPQTYTDVEEGMYLDCFSTAFDEVCTEEDTTVMIQTKQEAKRTAKSLVRHKYRIGDKYATRRKTTKGDVMGDEVYEVKKFIYTIGDSIVNTVVMKQLCGKPCERKPLTPFDCMTFHIKYEPSLFVFFMNVRFFKLSDEEASNKIDSWKKSLIGGVPKVEHKDLFGGAVWWSSLMDSNIKYEIGKEMIC